MFRPGLQNLSGTNSASGFQHLFLLRQRLAKYVGDDMAVDVSQSEVSSGVTVR